VIMVMWSIWSSRNRWTHGEKGFDPSVAIKAVHETLLELELPPKHKAPKEARPECTWHGPGTDVIKLNLDGAVNEWDRVTGSGGIARDAAGMFRGAWCKAYPGVMDPLTSEALALRDAVIFARSQNFSRVLFETDCSELVRLWEARKCTRPLIAPLLNEVSVLSLEFHTFTISFARCSANNLAHECACFACTHNVSEEWTETSPVFL
jgi:hypothetical protein